MGFFQKRFIPIRGSVHWAAFFGFFSGIFLRSFVPFRGRVHWPGAGETGGDGGVEMLLCSLLKEHRLFGLLAFTLWKADSSCDVTKSMHQRYVWCMSGTKQKQLTGLRSVTDRLYIVLVIISRKVIYVRLKNSVDIHSNMYLSFPHGIYIRKCSLF